MKWRKKRHLRRRFGREEISKEPNGMLKALSRGEKPRFVYWKSGRKPYVLGLSRWKKTSKKPRCSHGDKWAYL